MKIGVMTYVRTDNYGAELQGYALQHKLNIMGHEAECINVDKVEIDKDTFKLMAKKAIINRLRKNPLQAIPQISMLIYVNLRSRLFKKKGTKSNYQIEREKAFDEFFANAINHTSFLTLEELYEKGTDHQVLIAGSDQIWNYTRTGYLDPYFLTFAREGQKKVSYAASFSVSSIPDDRKEKYKNLLKNIDCISVRESQGVDLVKQLDGRDATLVLDPTLLLNKEKWMKIASDRYKFDFPYIFTYSLNTSTKYWDIVYQYAEKYNLKIINLRHDFEKEKEHKNRIDIFDAGPREFIYLLANAVLVITNSFHGTIFSINFNVPFVSILNKISETNSRITSILEKFGLEDRYIFDSGKIKQLPPKEMSFETANLKLDEEREKSQDFLTNAIN